MEFTGTLYTITGPSGVGKTSLVASLCRNSHNPVLSISHTTRQMRPNEQQGVNYFFVNDEEFQALEEADAFLESATVFGNRYGTSREWVVEQLHRNINVVLEIDWQGAATIRQHSITSKGIFILPPSLDALRTRLHGRKQDDRQTIRNRLAQAQREIARFRDADYLIVNEDFDRSLADLKTIVQQRQAPQLTLEQQQSRYQALLKELLKGAE